MLFQGMLIHFFRLGFRGKEAMAARATTEWASVEHRHRRIEEPATHRSANVQTTTVGAAKFAVGDHSKA
jgi:hypothetical protein